MRIASYLCALRRSHEARERGAAQGLVWVSHPILEKQQIDLAAWLGKEWVMPNCTHAEIATCYGAAFAAASDSSPDAKPA